MDKIHLVSKTIIFHVLKSDWVSSVWLLPSHQITSDSRPDKDWSILLITLMYRRRIKFWLIFHCTLPHIVWLDMKHNSVFSFLIKKKTNNKSKVIDFTSQLLHMISDGSTYFSIYIYVYVHTLNLWKLHVVNQWCVHILIIFICYCLSQVHFIQCRLH